MKTQSLLCAVLLFVCCACDYGHDLPSSNVINEGKMILILKDICLNEARFQRRMHPVGVNNSDLLYESYAYIFDYHQVSIMDFKNAYAKYADSPDEMQILYDSVITLLTQEQDKIDIGGAPKF